MNSDPLASDHDQTDSPLLNDVIDLGKDSTGTDSQSFKNSSDNNGNGEKNARKEQVSDSTPDNLLKEVSISEALRMHAGYVTVNGIISSLSQLQKMISSTNLNCSKCGYSQKIKQDMPKTAGQINNREPNKCLSCNENNPTTTYEYVNAITIELQDPNTFNEIERLPVVLFDKDTWDIYAGERVNVTGHIHIIQNRTRGKFFAFLYSDSINYEKREELSLTQQDIESIERFAKKNTSIVIDKLVSMFALSVIGYNHVKKGLLLSAANTSRDSSPSKRKRINALLIGESGLAKSSLLREAAKLVPNSRYESGQSSSAKSLTAILSKEEESYVLRLGPIPMAKESICCINELGRISFEDQAHFLDIMEEGRFTINKYGIHADIDSPTTVIVTANPINNSTWQDNNKINLNEIPAIKPLIERFDLIFVFRKPIEEAAIREYAYMKSDLDNKRIPNYFPFLRKFILYAKRLNPVLSEEAKTMLNEYWVKIAGNYGSPRILETLFRLAKALARLKLKHEVDADDARETMEYYNVILLQHQQVVTIPDSPRDVAYNECLSMLKQSKWPLVFEELAKAVSGRNEQVRNYLGHELKLNKNWKLKNIREMLLNHDSVRQVQEKPSVLRWIETYSNNVIEDNSGQCEVCEVCEVEKEPVVEKKEEKESTNLQKSTTHSTHTTQSAEEQAPTTTAKGPVLSLSGLFQCFHCSECFSSDTERLKHRGLAHPDKLDYPEPEDFNNRLRPNRPVTKAISSVKVKEPGISNQAEYA
jgi:replicative DNA helicase Mcm